MSSNFVIIEDKAQLNILSDSKLTKSVLFYNMQSRNFPSKILRKLKSNKKLHIESSKQYFSLVPITKSAPKVQMKNLPDKTYEFTCLKHSRPSSSFDTKLPENFKYKSQTQ